MSRDPSSTYYDAGGIETLDIIKAKLTEEEFRGYLKGNMLKYLSRSNHKGSHDRDIEKVGYYHAELAKLVKPTNLQKLLRSPLQQPRSLWQSFDAADIKLDGRAAGQAVLTIPPLEQWNWEPLSRSCNQPGAPISVEPRWQHEGLKKDPTQPWGTEVNGPHPDYVAHGGL